VWVIPFDNRPGSTNKLVSVGLSFDIRKFPKPTDITPDQEWRRFLSRFPSIYEQFKDAKPVRDWVSSDQMQISLRHSVGESLGDYGRRHGQRFPGCHLLARSGFVHGSNQRAGVALVAGSEVRRLHCGPFRVRRARARSGPH
jgi:hypothetical protein